MSKKDLETWIEKVFYKTPFFIKSLENKKVAGSYNLTLEGSINSSRLFGLGFSAFAIRVYKICNSLNKSDILPFKNYLLSFKNEDNYFEDKYISKKTFILRILRSLKNKDLRFINNNYTKLAETRQALAALMNLGVNVKNYLPIDFLKLDYKIFLSTLNWNKPWSSCSYINHFLFLNNYLISDTSEKNNNNEILLDFLLSKRNEIGSFGKTQSKNSMQITGSTMKILMALSIINKEFLIINENIIDNLLINRNCKNACEEVNLAFCLSSCLTHSDYRSKDITNYLLRLLERWKNLYFFEQFNGFSFYQNRSQNYYYDAKVSKGLNVPDMHGTAMFILGFEKVLKALKHKRAKLFQSCYL